MKNISEFPKNKLYNFLNSFYFSNFLFFLFFYFKGIFNFICKSNLTHLKFLIKTTQPNKPNARACMHEHVAKPYDEFLI